ncbi:hypothetical protein KIN20_002120 [Parelaphostrongylus tenuis]|uniref:Uncharacterized protein n=1 Tax=Parelaphostrongylus tenuis TaxID=148309 RepID=A0AAD5LV71_PARTN|nr:hypothetical protein KIN20_002120 [Parelaphostrongylus tenuis]
MKFSRNLTEFETALNNFEITEFHATGTSIETASAMLAKISSLATTISPLYSTDGTASGIQRIRENIIHHCYHCYFVLYDYYAHVPCPLLRRTLLAVKKLLLSLKGKARCSFYKSLLVSLAGLGTMSICQISAHVYRDLMELASR